MNHLCKYRINITDLFLKPYDNRASWLKIDLLYRINCLKTRQTNHEHNLPVYHAVPQLLTHRSIYWQASLIFSTIPHGPGYHTGIHPPGTNLPETRARWGRKHDTPETFTYRKALIVKNPEWDTSSLATCWSFVINLIYENRGTESAAGSLSLLERRAPRCLLGVAAVLRKEMERKRRVLLNEPVIKQSVGRHPTSTNEITSDFSAPLFLSHRKQTSSSLLRENRQ